MKKELFIKIFCVLIIAASAVFVANRVWGVVNVAGILNMGGNKIIALGNPDPATNSDTANVGYVKTVVAGAGQQNYLPKWDSVLALTKSLISDDGTIIDFHQKESNNFVIDKVTTNPVSPVIGQIWMCVDSGFDCQ